MSREDILDKHERLGNPGVHRGVGNMDMLQSKLPDIDAHENNSVAMRHTPQLILIVHQMADNILLVDHQREASCDVVVSHNDVGAYDDEDNYNLKGMEGTQRMGQNNGACELLHTCHWPCIV